MGKLAQYKKAFVAGVSFALTVAAAGLEGHLIPDVALPYVVAGIGVCGAYGVYAVRNQTPKDPS